MRTHDYGVILASTPTTITRAVIIDGTVHVQRFTAPVEIPLDLAAAEDVMMLAEQAVEAQQQEAQQGDAYLSKLLVQETTAQMQERC